MSDAFLAKILSVTFFLLIVVDQKVLVPVGCPTKVHSTAAFALRNGKFSSLGWLNFHTPLKFRPA